MNKKMQRAAFVTLSVFIGIFLLVSCGNSEIHWHDWDWNGDRFGNPYVPGSGLRRCQIETCIDGPPLFPGEPPAQALAVAGDTGPAGGIIIYSQASGFNFYIETDPEIEAEKRNYLEALPFFQVQLKYTWPNVPIFTSEEMYDISNRINEVGTGYRNTLALEKKDPSNPLVRDCLDMVFNDFDDWFLPSINELNELYNNQRFFQMHQGYYWSSSPSTTSIKNAWARDFINNQRSDYPRTEPGRIYPIRAF